VADLQKITDDLSKLTVLEAADLSKMLKGKWSGAGAAPPASVLFEKRGRSRTEPLKRGEGLFEFYDRCASPGYHEFRAIVNGWLAQMPADAWDELISRMRYGGAREFGSSLAEMIFYRMLSRLEWVALVGDTGFEPVRLEQGAIAMIPHGDPHVVSSAPNLRMSD
jgi:hypothetical protein